MIAIVSILQHVELETIVQATKHPMKQEKQKSLELTFDRPWLDDASLAPLPPTVLVFSGGYAFPGLLFAHPLAAFPPWLLHYVLFRIAS